MNSQEQCLAYSIRLSLATSDKVMNTKLKITTLISIAILALQIANKIIKDLEK